jgi:hypothetical protein
MIESGNRHMPDEILEIVFKMIPKKERNNLLDRCLRFDSSFEFISRAILLSRKRGSVISQLAHIYSKEREKALTFFRLAKIKRFDANLLQDILIDICTKGDLVFIQMFIDVGLSVNELRGENDVILCQAVKKGHDKILGHFIEHGLKLNDIQTSSNLIDAVIQNCSVNILRLVLCIGVTLNDLRIENNLLLHNACKKGEGHIVMWLLDLGITSKEIVESGALKCVCALGDIDIMNLLLPKLTAKEIVISKGLSSACFNSKIDIVVLLLSQLTAQHLLACQLDKCLRSKSPQIIKLLIETGLTYNDMKNARREEYGFLWWACATCNIDTIKIFLDEGFTVKDIQNVYPDAFTYLGGRRNRKFIKFLEDIGYEEC